MTTQERFWAKVEKTPECWVWTAATNGSGYGRFMPDARRSGDRRLVYAHRFAYEEARGAIPEGLELDHLCRNTLCVRPDHLEAVAHRENIVRGFPRGTTCRHGHRWSDSTPTGLPNLTFLPGGGRYCRSCNSARQRARSRLRS